MFGASAWGRLWQPIDNTCTTNLVGEPRKRNHVCVCREMVSIHSRSTTVFLIDVNVRINAYLVDTSRMRKAVLFSKLVASSRWN